MRLFGSWSAAQGASGGPWRLGTQWVPSKHTHMSASPVGSNADVVLHEREETWMAEPSLPLKEGGTWPGSLVQASISRFSQLSCETEQGSQCGAKSHFLVIVILVP